MHKNIPKIYYYISEFNKDEINNLNKNIALIYRNYQNNLDLNLINKIKKYCKKNKRKLFLANNIKIAIKMDLDGVYLPSFNNNMRINIFRKKKKFIILGSAHSVKEIRIKEKQHCHLIFLSPIFEILKSNKKLDISNFNNLASATQKKIIALGGINRKNFKKLKLLKIYGYAAIRLFKKG